MQPTEAENQIQIAVIDETYFEDEDESDISERSEKFRRLLEAEHGVTFEEADIGPSASIPAFVAFLAANYEVIGGALLTIFFAGKRIEDNWNWWRKRAKLVRSFAMRPINLNRNGASILAVEAVLNEIGEEPTALKLVRYGIGHMGDADDLASFQIEHEKDGPTDTLFLGFTKHVFEIEADDRSFRVGVDGSEVEVIEVNRNTDAKLVD